MKPETQYARNADDQYIAYQVCGSGEFDIIFIPDWCTNLEVMWEDPTLERFLNRLASMARLICFDKRGTGVSDPVPLGAVPTVEEWMDDVRFVLDAAGSESAAVFGHGDGAPMAILFAATPSQPRFRSRAGGCVRAQNPGPGLPTRYAARHG